MSRLFSYFDGSDLHADFSEELTIYHSDNWLKALSNYYGYQPSSRIITDGSQVSAFAPLVTVSNLTGRKLSSPPASMYGHLLASSDDALEELVKNLRFSAMEQECALVVKSLQQPLNGMYELSREVDCRVVVTSKESLWQSIDGTARRAVKKSIKEGVSVKISGLSDLGTFMALLAETRRRLGLPISPRGWIGEVLSHDFGRLLIAERSGRPIAGLLYTEDDNHIHYALPAYNQEGGRVRAMDAIIWYLLQIASARGKKFVQFGGSAESNEGLRRFKRKWGGEERSVFLWKDRPKAATRSAHQYLPKKKALLRFVPDRGLEALGYIYLRYFQ